MDITPAAHNTSVVHMRNIAALPDVPSPATSQAYMFVDTKRVVSDMMDMGFVVAGFRRPKVRSQSGGYALHEVDFRRPQDVSRPDGEAPRIIFLNSYDGSRKAQIVTGVIRFLCTNGLVTGDIAQNERFLHLGDYEEQLHAYIKDAGKRAGEVFDGIEKFRGMTLDRRLYKEMAQRALKLRYPEVDGEVSLSVDPETLLIPRRREDLRSDLWTNWNRLQENLLKGGVPGVDKDGKIRTIRPLAHIERSNKLNSRLWDLLEEYSEKA